MTAALTLYYDRSCPFCDAEMARLRRWDRHGRLAFIDMSVPGFDPAPLGASLAQLNLQLYSQSAHGQVLVGIDSILLAYRLVGRGWLVWPLRVPLLRPCLAWLYRGFARHRYRMSALLGYRAAAQCDSGVCAHRHRLFNDRTPS